VLWCSARNYITRRLVLV